MKIQGGMFCRRLCVPVAAQKSTHRARNTMAVLLSGAAGGVSLFALRDDDFHCPRCGVPCRDQRAVQPAHSTLGRPPRERFEPGRENEGERRKFVAWFPQNRGRSEAAAGTAFKRWWRTARFCKG